MIEIKNSRDRVIRRSANLRGLRAHINENTVKYVVIAPKATSTGSQHVTGIAGGYMTVYFENGQWCHCEWASYGVLCRSLRYWRGLYGVKLYLCSDKENCLGEIGYSNNYLETHKCF